MPDDEMASTTTTTTTVSSNDAPPTPVPSTDPLLGIPDGAAPSDEHDLFKLAPADALKLLAASVELLVRMTGDVPPTPPPKTPTDPQMRAMQAEKENIARSRSETNLARMRLMAISKTDSPVSVPVPQSDKQVGANNVQAYNAAMAARLMAQQASLSSTPSSSSPSAPKHESIDGVRLRQDTTPSPQVDPYLIIGADSQPLNMQHGAITRKFYSKKEPPISIQQYLVRLHQFCPMSTAVYLATSLYIHRLAVEERAIPVTRRNAHRLVLAGLRVAMKALEDLSYPHGKIAKVGGVSEVELARLEISFCFLAGFELVVGEEQMRDHWEGLRNGRAQQIISGTEVPTLRLERKPRQVSTTGADAT